MVLSVYREERDLRWDPLEVARHFALRHRFRFLHCRYREKHLCSLESSCCESRVLDDKGHRRGDQAARLSKRLEWSVCKAGDTRRRFHPNRSVIVDVDDLDAWMMKFWSAYAIVDPFEDSDSVLDNGVTPKKEKIQICYLSSCWKE